MILYFFFAQNISYTEKNSSNILWTTTQIYFEHNPTLHVLLTWLKPLSRFEFQFQCAYNAFTKVSFFVQCTKVQLITLQNCNIQTFFSQFLWFFSVKCWFKGQIISRIHLSLPNVYSVLIEISIEIGMLSFWSVINCFCNGA